MKTNILQALSARRDEEESGFTLIEILVVIIIIGILAAVAIPIFLNQQKTARDSATVQDVRNAATNVETGLVSDPNAVGEDFSISGGGATSTEAVVTVGDATPITISKTEGTVLSLEGVEGETGKFVVTGYNENGNEYTGPAPDGNGVATYNNALGGMQ